MEDRYSRRRFPAPFSPFPTGCVFVLERCPPPWIRALRASVRVLGGELIEERKEGYLIVPSENLSRLQAGLRRSELPFLVDFALLIERCSPPSRRPIWQCGSERLSLSRRVLIMGILNVTPDSFSDGGEAFGAEAAVRRAGELVAEGADILDVGGESTRPGAEPVPEEEETRRVLPVVERLAKEISVPISIDTTKAGVARRAIDAGASIVNDISAMRFDPRMAELVRRSGSGLVLMHMKGLPSTMQRRPAYRSLIGEIFHFLDGRRDAALRAGIQEDQIVLDPGIGFGKSGRHNLQILHRMAEFLPLGRPLLVGPSRKAFIGRILDLPPSERLEGTAAAVTAAVLGGARVLRVHDVHAMARVVRVAEAIAQERTRTS